MFAVNHWQLDQNSCLPNDAVLCSIAAVPAAAGTPSWGIWVLQGWALQEWWPTWWPWDAQRGVGGSVGLLLVQLDQAGHSQGLSLPPASGRGKTSQFPLQSLQHSLHGAAGEEKTSPSQNCKGKREPEPFQPEP